MIKILWITSGSFIDTDYYAVKELSKFYSITWCVFHKKFENFEYKTEIQDLEKTNVDVRVVEACEHSRYARNIFVYYLS